MTPIDWTKALSAVSASAMRMLWQRNGRPWVLGPPQRDLQFPPGQKVGLYLHVPFCRQLCAFCPYVKFPWTPLAGEGTKDAMIREIQLRGQQHPLLALSSVYIGGGTPILFLPWLEEILESLSHFFVLPKARGIELHPEDMDRSTLNALHSLGFDRISVGVQSFWDHHIRRLDRNPLDAASRIEEARKAGFHAVNVDLLLGLSEQTPDELQQDVRLAFERGATQISTYPFIRFSGHASSPHGLPARRQNLLFEALLEITRDLGLERHGVWTFALPRTPLYTSVTRPLFLGIGPSAVSLDVTQLTFNTFSLSTYREQLLQGELPTTYALPLTPRMRQMLWVFWQAYQLSLPSGSFLELFDRPLKQVFSRDLSLAQRLGCLRATETGYTVTERGAKIFHHLEQAFTHHYIDRVWQASQQDPLPKSLRLF